MMEIAVCKNPWCKAQFTYEGEKPKTCKKCESFENDLSGGITWTDKKYDGPRNDGMPHIMNTKANYFADNKRRY